MSQVSSTTTTPSKGFWSWMHRSKAWVESLATRKHAVSSLFILALAESIFFPIPVDILLITLCVGAPKRAFYFAFIAAVGSVIGGVGGYFLGHWMWYLPDGSFSDVANFFFNVIPGFSFEVFEQAGILYNQYDFWAVFIAGVSPIPYKVATISAGVFNINFWIFTLASVISRAGRYFALGALFFFFGATIKAFIDKYFELISILFLVSLIGGFVILKYLV